MSTMKVEIRQATAAEIADLGVLGGYVYGGTFGTARTTSSVA